MRLAILCLFIANSGLLPAQQQWSLKVRSIKIESISTSPWGLASVAFDTIAAAWKDKQVQLAVENVLDVTSIDKAKDVIREIYAREGQAVRVEHLTMAIPPRGLEIVFRVIQLCTCDQAGRELGSARARASSSAA